MTDKANTVRDLGERGLIRWFQDLITPFDEALLSGMEDAVAVPWDGNALVVNSDMLVASTDVLPGMTPAEISKMYKPNASHEKNFWNIRLLVTRAAINIPARTR